jgi:hypothetical protein
VCTVMEERVAGGSKKRKQREKESKNIRTGTQEVGDQQPEGRESIFFLCVSCACVHRYGTGSGR